MDTIEERRNLLKKSRLFGEFSPEIIEAIIPFLTPCDDKAGSLIFLKGEASDCLYIIRAGEVEVSVSSTEGRVILLGTLSEGDVFGEVGLLDKQSRTANVTAKTEVLLYRFSSADFNKVLKILGANELMALTSYICFLFRRVTNNLEETVFLDASVRVARKIEDIYEQTGDKGQNSFKISISQENLGRMAGLSREATNKALSRLEEEGLIQRQYRHIIVPDMSLFLRKLKTDN